MNDEVAALDFDLACTVRLRSYDNEQEQRLLEALTAGATMKAISQIVPHK
jgi:hypothetical protein